MDPLSIIGVAIAAVQFLDFGTRLLVETVDIHQGASTVSSRVTNLANTSDQLAEFARQIREKMSLLAASGHVLTVSETALLDACRACESSSQDVMELISKIRGRMMRMEEEGRQKKAIDPSDQHRSKLNSFRAAVKLVSKESQIHNMELRLRDIKSSLMLAMISNLWYDTRP